ncbi:MAG: PAS domain S-box protein [Nitrospirae bacterium]|nr:PAS domain S-box protein [Nitrospirota bacterium]
MRDENRTKEQLTNELSKLRQRITELEVVETSLRRAEESLTQSKHRYRTLVENVPHGIQENDTDGIITFSNPAHSRMHGYKEGELVGKPIWEMLASEEKQEELRRYLEMLVREQPPPTPYITQDRTKDGRVIDIQVDWDYQRDKEGKVTGFISVITDITERKRVEEALRESHQLIEKTFASLNDAIFIIDADTVKIINCNPAALEIFGYSRQEMLGRTIAFLHIDETTRDEFRKNLYSSVEEKGFLSQFEFRMRRKNGTVFPTEHSVIPLDNTDGKRIGWVSVVRDITERKKAEKEMLKSQKLESLGILAGGIAHDFNNLLTAILGNISIAKSFADSDAKDNMHRALKEAENASIRAKSLSQQLLTFASGGFPVKKVISVGGFIKEAAGFALMGSNVGCAYSISDDLAPVEVDEGQIGQVIQNLIINACQAMPEGGVINVHAEHINIDSKKALPLKPGRYVKISIKDHGVGIPQKHISKIFDPYFTTKQTGSGLGLATTYSIIKNHGGHITVNSKVGEGTTFCVYLPATDKKVDVEMDTGKGSFLGQGRILIMDDEEIIRNFACDALRHFGYEVDSAINGDEAINLYKRAGELGQPFNVVILDLTVPGGMGGKETVKELLKIDPGANVIVSSGYSNDPIMAEYEKYGFKGVVAKPYKLKELSAVVNKVIKGIGE